MCVVADYEKRHLTKVSKVNLEKAEAWSILLYRREREIEFNVKNDSLVIFQWNLWKVDWKVGNHMPTTAILVFKRIDFVFIENFKMLLTYWSALAMITGNI